MTFTIGLTPVNIMDSPKPDHKFVPKIPKLIQRKKIIKNEEMQEEEKLLAEVDQCDLLYKIYSAWQIMAFLVEFKGTNLTLRTHRKYGPF